MPTPSKSTAPLTPLEEEAAAEGEGRGREVPEPCGVVPELSGMAPLVPELYGMSLVPEPCGVFPELCGIALARLVVDAATMPVSQLYMPCTPEEGGGRRR